MRSTGSLSLGERVDSCLVEEKEVGIVRNSYNSLSAVMHHA